MAKTRTALALARKLEKIDNAIWRELMKDNYNAAKVEQMETKQATLVKEAVKKGLPLISIQVADGSALYYEINRTTRLVTFKWLYGGGDGYVSGFGKIVAVPVKTANQLIKRFNPKQI